MATELIATGTGAATSADVVVAAGTPVTVCLKDAAGPSVENNPLVEIQIKDDDSEYFLVGQLTQVVPVYVIVGPGTYRLSRPASSASCGAFSA